jgi:hypothetical protein
MKRSGVSNFVSHENLPISRCPEIRHSTTRANIDKLVTLSRRARPLREDHVARVNPSVNHRIRAGPHRRQPEIASKLLAAGYSNIARIEHEHVRSVTREVLNVSNSSLSFCAAESTLYGGQIVKVQ